MIPEEEDMQKERGVQEGDSRGDVAAADGLREGAATAEGDSREGVMGGSCGGGAAVENNSRGGAARGSLGAPVENNSRGGVARALSRLVSALLNPFVVAALAMLYFMSMDVAAATAPFRVRVFLYAAVVLNSLIIPLLFISLMRTLRVIGGPRESERQGRTVPAAVAAFAYGISIFMMGVNPYAALVRELFMVAFACAVAALIVLFFRNISVHMIAAGGVWAVLVLFSIAGISSLFVPVLVWTLVCGALGSARIYLERESLGEVGAGFLVGLVVAAAVLLNMF